MTSAMPLTRRDLLDLPAAVDVATAGRAFGLGRTTAYALAKADRFPCRVIRAGKSYRVVTADLLRVLQVAPDRPACAHAPINSEAAAVAPATASSEQPTQTA
ncbi:integrase [Streptomyces sp. CH6]|uniref:integrase n=1 Tax=Streptomyces sp. CH6 TaxID=3420320 RepID=UPI003CFE759E